MDGPSYRRAQLSSPVALLIIDLCAIEGSTLRRALDTASLFMLRLTCRAASAAIPLEPFSKRDAMAVALGEKERDGDVAAHHGPMIRWCLEAGADVGGRATMTKLARAGDADLLRQCMTFVDDTDSTYTMSAIEGAARGGHGDLVRSLVADLPPGSSAWLSSEVARRSVAAGGLLDLAQDIDDDPLRWRGTVLCEALENAQISFCWWVLQGVVPGEDNDPRYAAAALRSGSVDMCAWVLARGWSLGDDPMAAAAGSGSLELLQWLADLGERVSPAAVATAARSGHLPALRWLVELRGDREAPLDADVLYEAGQSRKPRLILWLLDEADCPFDPAILLPLVAPCPAPRQTFNAIVDKVLASTDDPLLLCRRALLPRNAFDPRRLCALFHLALPPWAAEYAVRASLLGLLRAALATGAPLELPVVAEAIRRRDCAALDLLLRTWVRHVPAETGDVNRSLILSLVHGEGDACPAIVEVLAAYGI